MLAGRPHEAVGNGSPRWMTAAPRKRGTEPGLQADSPFGHAADLRFGNSQASAGQIRGTCQYRAMSYQAVLRDICAYSGQIPKLEYSVNR